MSAVVLQKLQKEFENRLQKAIAYYSILSAFNSLNLQTREIEVLAFAATRGTITPASARREFVRIFDSSLATLENVKCRLIKKGLLQKHGEMYRVNPSIAPDFSGGVIMQINLSSLT
ncbi:hypothetical protein SAMN05428988_3201 [Chitinophaga sp. YR573]|uniref:hypothetical protein n=1 Tax=Chitinophaga sp. YR573 TaxID=1881040 RepID=UPI0008AB8671|nr:hypothetical protein [Chitinophaga sp. YR573]SEW21349.1 hypothetical protein SAMN05428988_3201 [Chitinophaga sp. YR573]